MDPVSTALTTWVARGLAKKTVAVIGARMRRDQDAPDVRKALAVAVKSGVAAAVADVHHDDPEGARQVELALLEREDARLPLVDGTGLAGLVDAVRVWIAETESPVGETGLPEEIDASHPLAAALCEAVLHRIRREATRGERILAPLWMDFKLTCLQQPTARRPERLRDYWHPGTPGTRFVGRRDELTRLADALTPGERGGRVQVVGGVGGIGKTALAVAYAQKHASRYRDGAIFYDFQSYAVGRAPDSADQALVKILPTIRDDLSSAGVEQLSAVGRMSAWQESTADRELLMVWDNVRSLAQIEPLLLWQSGCATILTTRHDIDVDGADPLRLRSLEREAARDLFTGIAGDGHDEDLVRRLLEADLDVPILIKAHAKQIRAGRRGLGEIVAELSGVEPVGHRRTQQAFFDRLDGSYLHLGADQRYAFRFLGAHPGRFATGEVAAAILGCELDEAVDLMEDLVDVGLARRHHRPAADPRPPAYTAHDILRAYAAHQARSEGELTPIRDELSAYYRQRLDEPNGGDRRWVETELDNIGDTALAGRTGAHAELASRVGERFFAFGRFTDAATVFGRAAEVYLDGGDDARHAHALLGLGEVARLQGEWDRSLELCRRAVVIFERRDDVGGLIKASVGLGHVSRLKGELEDGARYFEQAAEQAGAAGDTPVQARALVGLGHVLRLQRRHPEALERFAAAAELGDPLQRANALRGIGDVHRALGAPSEAESRYAEAAATYAELGDRNGEANAHLGRGAVAVLEERWPEAEAAYRTAEEIFTELGNRFGLGTALRGQGTAAAGAADSVRARRLLGEALAIYSVLRSPAATGVAGQLRELDARENTA
ncbi:tetratricopeptide repeat protein [Phytomonospora endophytica]|uniref:Tetratricopeptide (TPR) repeat protein n=1 Tax=Phytomonospora endophytica TaxID=714109 RepID=A0A841FFH9_9ACTN|nr:tetratricopeptide repeat protein [Phytomonospora endophytica]MBB6035026.1 tetratricopeptide (TPR) repeat protein [Phytomonospora endophytica]GIG68280.1 hypothetical protein Pen01_45750 [Phytomonospora endophytica]